MGHKELFHRAISNKSIKSKINRQSPKVDKIENFSGEIIFLPKTRFVPKFIFQDQKFPKTKIPKMENLRKIKKRPTADLSLGNTGGCRGEFSTMIMIVNFRVIKGLS